MDTKSDSDAAREARHLDARSTPRQPWALPRISDLGSLRHLVRGGSGTVGDGAGMNMQA